jgi:hypothetical protein
MSCISGIRGRRKRRKPRRWVVCVCVMSLAALRVRFPVCSGGLGGSLYDTLEADTLGRN